MRMVCLCGSSSNFANVNDNDDGVNANANNASNANANNASNANDGVRPLCNRAGLCVG